MLPYIAYMDPMGIYFQVYFGRLHRAEAESVTTHFALPVALRVAPEKPIGPIARRRHNWSEAHGLWVKGCQRLAAVNMLHVVVCHCDTG
jgi:hypothetical protein